MKTSTVAGAGIGCGTLTFFISIWVGISYIIGLWTERNLEFWIAYFKHAPVDVPLVWAWLLSLVCPPIVLLNILAEIAKLIVS